MLEIPMVKVMLGNNPSNDEIILYIKNLEGMVVPPSDHTREELLCLLDIRSYITKNYGPLQYQYREGTVEYRIVIEILRRFSM